MATLFEELTDDLCDFINAQHMFFVATAPSSNDGFVNCSPKGLDTLRILDRKTIAYLDLTGSGVETIAHLKENGRLVMMFCSFGNKPKILRLHGKGTVLETHDPGFAELISEFPEMRGTRAIIKLDVARIADSCGWGVPKFDFVSDRDTYGKYADAMSDEDLRESQKAQNSFSLDDLPALSRPSL